MSVLHISNSPSRDVQDSSFLKGDGLLAPAPRCKVLQDNVHPDHSVLAKVTVTDVELSHHLFCGDVKVAQICSGKHWDPGWPPGWTWNTQYTFANNSALDDSELVPPFDYFIPLIKVLPNVFHALAGLNPQKAYGPDAVLLFVFKNCVSVLAPCLAKLFQILVKLLMSR
ncbi:hypothetical protein E2C01_022259 [Portunus trituberculatus]|uniref:Uncharacterized protein n=1 Tax=Portunus trituberculatus TaxID=210409 RepID=A0A5B7E4W8_PORTR|nr:hypothetical protein [Portunus trituberculatus]